MTTLLLDSSLRKAGVGRHLIYTCGTLHYLNFLNSRILRRLLRRQKISKQKVLDRSMMGLLESIQLALDLPRDAASLRSRYKQSVNHGKTLTRLLE